MVSFLKFVLYCKVVLCILREEYIRIFLTCIFLSFIALLFIEVTSFLIKHSLALFQKERKCIREFPRSRHANVMYLKGNGVHFVKKT